MGERRIVLNDPAFFYGGTDPRAGMVRRHGTDRITPEA